MGIIRFDCRWLPLLLALWLAGCPDAGKGGEGARSSPPAATSESPPAPLVSAAYEAGPHPVDIREVVEGEQGAPRRGLLFAPETAGQYPLIQFQHGFISAIENQRLMLGQLASHGFVVFAPQMYPPGNPMDAPGVAEEVALAAEISDWLKQTVNTLLIAAKADVGKFGLAGYSRGGQVVWRMLAENQASAQGLAGVDPVDGDAPPLSSDPGPMITGAPLRFGFPVYVLGSGLGPLVDPFACAPAERNYQHFTDASLDPVYQVVATEHGHADMLDYDCVQCRLACLSNPQPGMPEFTAGQLIAYFSQQLKGMDGEAFLSGKASAPVTASYEFQQ